MCHPDKTQCPLKTLILIFPETAYGGDKRSVQSYHPTITTDPSIMSSVNGAGLSHTGQIQVVFLCAQKH